MSIPLPDGAGTTKVLNEIEDQPESNTSDPLVDDILSDENVEGSTVEFPNVPEITQMGNDFPGFFATLLPNTMAALTADDFGKLEVFEDAFRDDKRWGGKFQDKFGNPMMVWNNRPYYVNKPGFTGTDVNTFLGEMLKYMPATKYASGAKSLLGTVARGSIAYTGTETASKIGENIVTPKTVEARDDTLGEIGTDIGVTSAIGVGADVVLPPLVKKGADILSPIAKPVVESIREGAEKITEGASAKVKAVKDLTVNRLPRFEPEVITESKYPLTQGQRTALPPEGVTPRQTDQLGQEDVLRQSASDDLGTDIIRGFDDRQLNEIRSDALQLQEEFGAGTVGSGGVYSNIPLAASEEIQTVVGREADRLKKESQEAYEAVKDAPVQPMMSPSGVNQVANEVLAEYRKVFSAGQLDSGPLMKEVNFLRKLIKMSENPKFTDVSLKNIHGYQKRLGTAIKQAPIGSAERLALEQMKRVTDDAVYNGIERGFITGDQAVLDQLQNATGLYKDYMGLIGKGVGKSAQEKAANRILSQITDQDYTPVQVTNLLFGHNKFSPNQAVPLALSKLRNILPEAQFLEVQALMKDAVLTKAFSGKGGEVTRTAIVNNFNDVFNKQGAVIKELFSPDEIARIKQFRQDVMPTLWAEIKLNPSGSGYTIMSGLARNGLLNFPMMGAGRVVAPTIIKSIDETAGTKTAVNAVRQTLDRFQAPLISGAVASGVRTETREDAPAENTGIQQMPQSMIENLQGSINNFQMPQVQGNMFEAPQPTLAPQQMMSPTILPNEDDREIAMRKQMGIAGLV
jgi:hypothetical protein